MYLHICIIYLYLCVCVCVCVCTVRNEQLLKNMECKTVKNHKVPCREVSNVLQVTDSEKRDHTQDFGLCSLPLSNVSAY